MGEQRACCASCGLWQTCKSPVMSGRGNTNQPKLAIVGEAPGGDEDAAGRPFVGRSGAIVNRLIEEFGLKEDDYWITNAVRCRPPGNETPTDKQLKHCKEFLEDELQAIQPKAILALGNSPMFSLLEKRGIVSDRGKVFKWRGIPVIPAFHPAYVLRNPSAGDYLVEDFFKAWQIAETGKVTEPQPVNYRIVKGYEDLCVLMDEIEKAEWVSWDIETTSLDAFAENASVVCVQMSTKMHSGWLIPVNHPERHENSLPMQRVRDFLYEVLEMEKGSSICGKKLCGQNLKFDMGYMKANLGITPRTPEFDCYLAHHLLYEEESQSGGNGLKAMAWKFTDMGGYEAYVEQAYPACYTRMREIPLEAAAGHDLRACLTYYACADTDVVLRVKDALFPKLEAEELDKVLKMELKKQDLLMRMEQRGAAIDWEEHGRMMESFPAQLERIREHLRNYPEVKKAEQAYPSRRAGGAEKHKVEPFNPNSVPQVRLLCYDILGLPKNEKFMTDKGELSTAAPVIVYWLAKLPEKCAAREIISLIVMGKRTAKLFGTYVKPLQSYAGRDGKVHTRYNQGRVVTGRLSSENPNLQQLPRDDEKIREGWVGKGNIKRMYTGGEPGWYVMEADYSQIELRIAALISQDEVMLSNYFNGEDLHSKTAAKVYGYDLEEFEALLKEDDTDAKRLRSLAKIINFGILYGMHAQSLSEKMGCTKRVAQAAIDAHGDLYRGYNRWEKETRRFALEHGYVVGLFGHRRHLPNVAAAERGIREDALRQAVNFPIQNTASLMTAYSQTKIDRIMTEDAMRSYTYMQVHDSIISTGPQEEKFKAAGLVKFVMENPGFEFLSGNFPGLPRVPPIEADVKLGLNLRDLKKL